LRWVGAGFFAEGAGFGGGVAARAEACAARADEFAHIHNAAKKAAARRGLFHLLNIVLLDGPAPGWLAAWHGQSLILRKATTTTQGKRSGFQGMCYTIGGTKYYEEKGKM
jgi:hypothetical protein